MSYKYKDKYVDLRINGRLFPTWILANFKNYKLDEIQLKEDEDPCLKIKDKSSEKKLELQKYQIFLSKFLDFNGPYKNIMVYHGVGAGKTLATINVYNVLYNYTPQWNVFILLPATLETTWKNELKRGLSQEEYEYRYKNINFISYNSPIADKQFLETVKKVDTSKKSIYIIEEAHNFFGNVYGNVTTKKGKRASTIYDFIMQEKKDNDDTRILLLSATPAINRPFELALMFNLLRPGSFPKSESEFNKLFIAPQGGFLNPASVNLFQRRILGLVSYYIGATPDKFAQKRYNYVDIEMSEYQKDIYTYFEEIEDTMARKSGGKIETYKSYTRQSSNFVFPPMGQGITGESRPRPNKFKISEKEALNIEKGKNFKDDSNINIENYLNALKLYTKSFDKFLNDAEKKDNDKHNIIHDFHNYSQKYNSDFNKFVKNENIKSSLFNAMYKCSAKFICAIFNIMLSKGPVLVYSNYVRMEGLEIFKIYLSYFGFVQYSDSSKENKNKNGFRYMEYSGEIDKEQRKKLLDIFNNKDNIKGDIAKIIMISPAGAEGLSLLNTRQVHIIEPYWHEARIEQMIGRAVRLCSHVDLPIKERYVDIFRYKSIIKDNKRSKPTTDQYIEQAAIDKKKLIDSFLNPIKGAAIDCSLYKNHNMMEKEYKCFQFDEPSLFDDQIGPAFKDNINEDIKNDNGTNSLNSNLVKIKVKKIKAVKLLSSPLDKSNIQYSKDDFYWFNPDTLVVYDFHLHFAIGKVGLDDDNLPLKIDDNTYVITRVIPIPLIEGK